jgi:hypothetical protein
VSDVREILPGFTVDRDEVTAITCTPSGDAFQVRVTHKDGSKKTTGVETEEEGWKAIYALTDVVPEA